MPRKLHAQQQEFQAVYECIDKITQFMSRAAIFSFMPILTKLLPESVTSIERGRYYRNRSELGAMMWRGSEFPIYILMDTVQSTFCVSKVETLGSLK